MRFFRDGDLRRINGGTGEINRLYYGGGLLEEGWIVQVVAVKGRYGNGTCGTGGWRG